MKSLVRALIIIVIANTSSAFGMEWQWLDAMRQSVQEMNYRGEFFHRRGDKTSVYSVVHQYVEGRSVELLRQLDGEMVEVLRDGKRMVCYYPEGAEAALNHAVPAAPFTQVTELDLDRISENYTAESAGQQRVAGYNAHVVILKSDEWRYRQRLWLEVETNLLLQSELIDSSDNIMEQFRFTRLELGVAIADSELKPSLENASARQQTAFRSEPEVPDDSRFRTKLDWLPIGFKLSHTDSRQNTEGWYEQRTFTDGLTTFSIFIENSGAMSGSQSALAKMGATTALMTSMKGHSVTVIGEIPSETAKKIAQMLSIDAPSI